MKKYEWVNIPVLIKEYEELWNAIEYIDDYLSTDRQRYDEMGTLQEFIKNILEIK